MLRRREPREPPEHGVDAPGLVPLSAPLLSFWHAVDDQGGPCLGPGDQAFEGSVIQRIQEFVVTEASRGPFELCFGPGGAWSRLVAGAPGFRGTMLLCDVVEPRRVLVVDVWETPAHWQALQSAQSEALAALDATLRQWAESARELGIFSQRTQATVRPFDRGRAGGRSPRRR